MNDKKMQELENRKQQQLENLKNENELNDYFNSYENALELQIESNELLKNVINDILKF